MSDKATPKAGAAGKSKSVIAIAAAVVLLGGGAGAWFMMRRAAPNVEAAAASEHKEPKDKEKGGVLSFEPFVVNLADPGGSRFLRVTVRLVVDEPETEELQKE